MFLLLTGQQSKYNTLQVSVELQQLHQLISLGELLLRQSS